MQTIQRCYASDRRGTDINQPQMTRRERIVEGILRLIRQIGVISG